jgi:hypothetical protein
VACLHVTGVPVSADVRDECVRFGTLGVVGRTPGDGCAFRVASLDAACPLHCRRCVRVVRNRASRSRWIAALTALAPILALADGGCGARSGFELPGDGVGRDPPDGDGGDLPWQRDQCSAYALGTELVPLDLYITMDTSGSMAGKTAAGTSKLEAVRSAIRDFLNDPKSAGIGVAMSFFPIVNVDVPKLCLDDEQCREAGACQPIFSCLPSGANACTTDAECANGDGCERVGYCGGDTNKPCADAHLPCASGESCIFGGWCSNHVKCDAAQYAPANEPVVIPGGISPVLAELNGKAPAGGTPTLPAIGGSIDAAIARAEKHPEHRSIVLLTTDGFPTMCDAAIPVSSAPPDAGIPKVVDEVRRGQEAGIRIFVIGVFAPEEEQAAQQNLDAIAGAGGSDKAWIITTNEPVADEFLATLNQIRKRAHGCEYSLPRDSRGQPLDPARLRLRIAGSQGVLWLEQRESLAHCDPGAGGFVCDEPLGSPTPPSRIELCPASCAIVDADASLTVEVVVDCAPR